MLGDTDLIRTVATELDGAEFSAVADEGTHGKEPMCRLLAPSPSVLRERVLTVASAADRDEAVT